MMRRGSLTSCGTVVTGAGAAVTGEPLIVVEESGGIAEEDEEAIAEEELQESGMDSLANRDSPLLPNPYLLSPYRDLRKRSLPTPQCTSGITASQVRRLSEQGGEGGKGPSPIEAAFLATLSTAPGPTPGGRRHSVVTISKAPKSSLLFGRNRRESFAAFPSSSSGPQQRFQRRDSTSSLVRTPSASGGGGGSSFNLQLDIMDDIAEIKAARKVKLKMWQNEAEENVCEVQPMDGGSTSRYHQKDNRRFSDVSGMQPQQQQSKRRASELPSTSSAPTQEQPPAAPALGKKKGGIVCSNSDLINIMSSLTSSAQEINTDNQEPTAAVAAVVPIPAKPSSIDQKRRLLQSNRSNSFDISLLPEAAKGGTETTKSPINWFTRRHLPMANKKYLTSKSEPEQHTSVVTLTDEKPKVSVVQEVKSPPKEKDHKVVWDKPSGSVVDAQVLGSAIEVFLTQRGGESTASQQQAPPEQPAKSQGDVPSSSSWFGKNTKAELEEDVTCDNSICSTLKDLFVK